MVEGSPLEFPSAAFSGGFRLARTYIEGRYSNRVDGDGEVLDSTVCVRLGINGRINLNPKVFSICSDLVCEHSLSRAESCVACILKVVSFRPRCESANCVLSNPDAGYYWKRIEFQPRLFVEHAEYDEEFLTAYFMGSVAVWSERSESRFKGEPSDVARSERFHA